MTLGLSRKSRLYPIHTVLPTKGILYCGQSNTSGLGDTLEQPTASNLVLQPYNATLQPFREPSADNTNSPPPWQQFVAWGQSSLGALCQQLRNLGEQSAIWAVNAGVPATSSAQWASLPSNPTSLVGVACKRFQECVRNAPAPFLIGPICYYQMESDGNTPPATYIANVDSVFNYLISYLPTLLDSAGNPIAFDKTTARGIIVCPPALNTIPPEANWTANRMAIQAYAAASAGRILLANAIAPPYVGTDQTHLNTGDASAGLQNLGLQEAQLWASAL